MFEYNRQFQHTFYYEPNKSETLKLPSGNLFHAMDLFTQLEVNISVGAASNAPDFQIMNAIERIELVRDNKVTVWSLSGQAAALLFTNRFGTGVAAVGNSTIAGATGNDKQGKHFLRMPFYPLDALKPWDFACDTRAHDYHLKIKWRDITAAGTLFGTINTITATNSENFVRLTLHQINPMANPVTGAADSLESNAPLIVGYREDKRSIDASNTKYQIDIAEWQQYRNLILYTTHVANTLQEVGENDIIQNLVRLYDTQNKTYHSLEAEELRNETSMRWGQGSNINAGVYDLSLLAFGSAFDVLKANNIRDLFMDLDVVKQANNTFVRLVGVTQEAQGGR